MRLEMGGTAQRRIAEGVGNRRGSVVRAVVSSAPDATDATRPERVERPMTARVFPFAALVLAYDASADDAERIAELVRAAADAGAAVVVVALPAGIDVPRDVRVVRTRAEASAIAALRLGMAQLTNTVARAVLLVPHRTVDRSLVAMLALVDAAKRDESAVVAFEGASLDRSALLVPRDAWLELVTTGEGGMGAVAACRRVIRVRAESA